MAKAFSRNAFVVKCMQVGKEGEWARTTILQTDISAQSIADNFDLGTACGCLLGFKKVPKLPKEP